MAKLILKAPYYKPNHRTDTGATRGGYVEYIAKREGVEILRGGMVEYIGQRQGSHGMFSDEGVSINLSKIKQKIDEHTGNVWGIIISLKREDAERLGYNTAEQWMNLIRSRRNDIASQMHISPSNLRWCAAYHNKELNPHTHIMVWSKNPSEPYLTRTGIHNLKTVFASDIFRQELTSIYKKQTSARNSIKEKYKIKIKNLIKDIRNGNHHISPELVIKIQLLSEKLDKSEWMFPSPVKNGEPRHPSSITKKFRIMLERANCKHVRFHDLRHTFATMALENGIDIKTLSSMIGHVSSETTVNI